MTSGSRYMVSLLHPRRHVADVDNPRLGDMIYFKVFGQGFLVLGSVKRVYDIFERRSSNYSDRPRLVMLNEMFVNFHNFHRRMCRVY